MVGNNCTVVGKWEEPEGWKILPKGYVVSDMPVVRDHESYMEARKWVIKEITGRRKNLGRVMESWLRKKRPEDERGDVKSE